MSDGTPMLDHILRVETEAGKFAQKFRDEEALRLHAESQVRDLTAALNLFLDPTTQPVPGWVADARAKARKLLYPTSNEEEQPWR